MKYIIDGGIPDKYKIQVQAQMYICGFLFVDFVVYHPNFDLYVYRVKRDDEVIDSIIEKLDKAKSEVKAIVDSFGVEVGESSLPEEEEEENINDQEVELF